MWLKNKWLLGGIRALPGGRRKGSGIKRSFFWREVLIMKNISVLEDFLGLHVARVTESDNG